MNPGKIPCSANLFAGMLLSYHFLIDFISTIQQAAVAVTTTTKILAPVPVFHKPQILTMQKTNPHINQQNKSPLNNVVTAKYSARPDDANGSKHNVSIQVLFFYFQACTLLLD